MNKSSFAARSPIAQLGILLSIAVNVLSAERTEHFDTDPGWDGHNNRASSPSPRTIRQDFGYSSSSHFGGPPGEMGGFITPAAEPAYYAKAIPNRTFNDPLSASGKIVCAGRKFHVLVGFFNSGTLNEWRTPNTIALRLQGRGDIFFAWVEYASSRWRAGADNPGGFTKIRDPITGRSTLKGFPTGSTVHTWSIRYDPNANGGTGSVTVTLDNETSICHVDPGHKADGATFNRFGLLNVMKQADDGGEIWLDDVTVNFGSRAVPGRSVNGETEPAAHPEGFDRDPHWDEFQNRRTYITHDVRPRFDFGYSSTQFAGGKARGEIGGLVFRGDGRYTNMMAFYGDRLEELTLNRPLKASGKIALHRGVSDSDVLFGFFHSEHSLNSGGSDRIGTPPDFLGVAIGAPSREGFYFAPAYRVHGTEKKNAERGPHILPNGAPHDWSLEYQPGDADIRNAGRAIPGTSGTITVTLDNERATLAIPGNHQAVGAHFNRFGIITTHTDGNGQHIYFDDLIYTWSQAANQ